MPLIPWPTLRKRRYERIKDIEALRQATQELNETMQKVGAAVYQQEPPPPPPDEETPPDKEEEGTVEGEFREV